MVRKPGPSSSGSPSRPDSPMSSKSGSGSNAGASAAGRSGTRAGTSAGTRAGTAVGAHPAFTTERADTAPAGGALMAMPMSRKPRPALVGLAIAGWATFAVQWVLVIVIILGRGDTARVAAAENIPASPPPPPP
ncbi:MAG: hypothetical protein AAFX76_14340, partial [Planctomycetota bacterium]